MIDVTLSGDEGQSTSAIRYQYDNHLGSASLELDNNANIISYEEYHPFGTTSYRSGRSETETSQKRYKYVGKERDEETGLYYYGARYYAAWICRFVSVDPMKEERIWLNPYNYVQNNPINRVDPTGMVDTNPPWKVPDVSTEDNPVLNEVVVKTKNIVKDKIKHGKSNPLSYMKIRRNRASNLGPGNVRTNGTQPHGGHDLYGKVGSDVMAVMSGKVIKVGYSGTYGNHITLEHKEAVYDTATDNETGRSKKTLVDVKISYSFYAHLDSFNIEQGDTVVVGDVIGKLGTTGNADDPNGHDEHLHFEYGTALRTGNYLAKESLLNPNMVYNGVSFRSENLEKNQTFTGVVKTVLKNGISVEYKQPLNSNNDILIRKKTMPKYVKNQY